MSRFTIKLIIILNSIALLGLIGTQMFWIKNAINMSEKHFDHRVNSAFRDILVDIEKANQNNVNNRNDSTLCLNQNETVYNILQNIGIDSLMTLHFDYHGIDTNYVYKIVLCIQDEIEYDDDKTALSDDFSLSLHKACLSCIWTEECFNLVVNFPDKRKFLLSDMSMWLFLSLLFLLNVVFGFS